MLESSKEFISCYLDSIKLKHVVLPSTMLMWAKTICSWTQGLERLLFPRKQVIFPTTFPCFQYKKGKFFPSFQIPFKCQNFHARSFPIILSVFHLRIDWRHWNSSTWQLWVLMKSLTTLALQKAVFIIVLKTLQQTLCLGFTLLRLKPVVSSHMITYTLHCF